MGEAPRVLIDAAADRSYSADEIPAIVAVLGSGGQVDYINSAGEQLLGHNFVELGSRAIELVHPDDVEVLQAELKRLFSEPGSRWSFEFRVVHANGSWRHLQTFGTNLIDDPRFRGIVLHSLDVTDLRQAQDRLKHERLHDPLTGYPTRRLFIEHLTRALRRAARMGSTLAVFGVDINGLGLVNEHGGYERGDAVLIRVGQDLDGVLRAYDTVAHADGVVGRLEDAFFVLCEDVPDSETAASIAARLGAAVRDGAITSPGNSVMVTATVGVVLSALGASDAESLLADATSAMHVGKERGGDRVEFYDKAIHQVAERRIQQLHDLRVAIAGNQLRLLYQPKIEIASGELRGVEALVRWEHPTLGLVSPADFIPMAEESGLIHPLGEWVLNEACRQRALWAGAIGDPSNFLLSVNVSSQQFNESFPALVRQIFSDTGAPTGSLCVEVTETAVMSDVDETIATMRELRELGVQISIDDFGTGYSSLAQLKRLPIDEVKIDQSFIERLGQDREDNAIVAAIVAMAHALDLPVVAEGVETPEQLAELRALGCELAQGFLFSRPVSAEAISRLLAEQLSTIPA